ncbi:Chaperone protein YcdY [Kluyvera cryocrescens]|uniref:Chaperone protein YcdY n=1 Tax=Kluyvera cryocrescens TaxID=580 RepID=A0A485CD22_KLUCR|nr:Chaperone protein YcdY [Kluyvera cryocrescens]
MNYWLVCKKAAISSKLLLIIMRCLFGEECSVPPVRSAWVEGATEAEVRAFLTGQGMPLGENPADQLGTLLLAASWLEDNVKDNDSEALDILFDDYIVPWVGTFLGKLEAHATTTFWRTMATLTREAISAMFDDLQEEHEE